MANSLESILKDESLSLEYRLNLIDNISNSQMVALVKERNRPSGGLRTVHEVAVNAFLNYDSYVLEIGSNTGFTSVNLALLTNCRVIGIDIIDDSIEEAKKYAKEQGVYDRVRFMNVNAENMPFDDETFDLVWASNVTSFIRNRKKAIKEYLRVLKTLGTLVVIPVYYVEKPPRDLVNEVSKVIDAKIDVWTKDYWLELFERVSKESDTALELYYAKDYRYDDKGEFIEQYVNEVLNKPHIKEMPKAIQDKIKERYTYFYRLFNENLKYAGFSVLLYQKRKIKDEVELFTIKEP